MTDEERDAWAEEVLARFRRHRRREISGLLTMLDEDLADCLDVLAVAPLLQYEELPVKEHERLRRLAYLQRYQPEGV